jgi:hypothetical protein
MCTETGECLKLWFRRREVAEATKGESPGMLRIEESGFSLRGVSLFLPELS